MESDILVSVVMGGQSNFVIDIAGAKNVALFVTSILANSNDEVSTKLKAYRKNQRDTVLENPIFKELL